MKETTVAPNSALGVFDPRPKRESAMTSTTASTTRGIKGGVKVDASRQGWSHKWLEAKVHNQLLSGPKGLIPPALWATGGLGLLTGKLPLSLPSPRASDPAGLE